MHAHQDLTDVRDPVIADIEAARAAKREREAAAAAAEAPPETPAADAPPPAFHGAENVLGAMQYLMGRAQKAACAGLNDCRVETTALILLVSAVGGLLEALATAKADLAAAEARAAELSRPPAAPEPWWRRLLARWSARAAA